MKAAFMSLSKGDLAKGLIMAVLAAIATAVYNLISGDSAHIPTIAELKTIGINAISVGILYLMKNFFTNSNDQFLSKEK